MNQKREHYYRTPSSCDYTYGDYLEYCGDMDITDDEIVPDESNEFYEWCENQIYWYDEPEIATYAFAEMVRDIIGDKNIKIDDIMNMYFYLKSNAVGWRRASAHSKPTKVKDVIDLMGNGYEDIEFYRELCEDGSWEYTMRMAGHDSTDYFEVIPFHEDFIVEIMDDMSDYMSIDDIVGHIGYYDFKNIKNMIAMVENIEDYDVEDMELVIDSLVDGVDNKMLMNLLKGGNDE